MHCHFSKYYRGPMYCGPRVSNIGGVGPRGPRSGYALGGEAEGISEVIARDPGR
jgi:hypothetical protein